MKAVLAVLFSGVLLACTQAGCSKDAAPGPPVQADGGTHATLDAGALFPIAVKGGQIVDPAGRTVILRGLQHHALQDVRYAGREVLSEDYPRIASWGFTTLRMAFSWSRLEPVRGAYDDTYLGEIRQALDAAHAAGLGVLLEWHQDLWGKCSQAETSPSAMNANGAPDWACPSGYDDTRPLAFPELFDRLYANEDGLLDAYVAAWQHVVRRLGDHPAVVGYDLLNEPNGTAPYPAFERDALFPTYRKTIAALRAAGARGPLLLEAPFRRFETYEMYTERFAEVDPDLVYAPHLYTGWFSLYILKRSPTQQSKELDFGKAAAQASAMGLPLWNGEWGVNLMLETGLDDLERHTTLEDRYRIGSSYWAFQRAVPGQGDDSISGGQSILDADRSVRFQVVDKIARPYPIQTPGALTSLAWDWESRKLTVEIDATDVSSPMVLYAPRRHLGASMCVAVEGPSARAWQWDEASNERLVVKLSAPGRHTVRLSRCE